jgi:hypothetical protein
VAPAATAFSAALLRSASSSTSSSSARSCCRAIQSSCQATRTRSRRSTRSARKRSPLARASSKACLPRARTLAGSVSIGSKASPSVVKSGPPAIICSSETRGSCRASSLSLTTRAERAAPLMPGALELGVGELGAAQQLLDRGLGGELGQSALLDRLRPLAVLVGEGLLFVVEACGREHAAREGQRATRRQYGIGRGT